MTEKPSQAEVENQRTTYLNGLYTRALGRDVEAMGELSLIALGGLPQAQDLVKQMDEKLATPKNVVVNSENKI